MDSVRKVLPIHEHKGETPAPAATPTVGHKADYCRGYADGHEDGIMEALLIVTDLLNKGADVTSIHRHFGFDDEPSEKAD